jgi:hypothetical protein
MSALAIYLNDHLGGSTAGRDLARRAAARNQGRGDYGPALTRIAREIAADRGSLLEAMAALGVRTDPIKVLGAWVGEKLSRLKPNGQLLGYSPLSRVVELESLSLGVRGKLNLWLALSDALAADERLRGLDLAELADRARRQIADLDELRQRAAREALG